MRWNALVLLSSLLCASPAAAQCRLCSAGSSMSGQTGSDVPVHLEVETSLDFDSVVLLGSAGGTATLDPNGTRTTTGGLQGLSSRAMIGEVVIKGEPYRSVRIDLPPRIDLFGTKGSLSITRISSDLASAPRLDADGRLRFKFGGELFISGDAEGQYRGNVPITVEYL